MVLRREFQPVDRANLSSPLEKKGTFSPTVTIIPALRGFPVQSQLPHLQCADTLIIEWNVFVAAIPGEEQPTHVSQQILP